MPSETLKRVLRPRVFAMYLIWALMTFTILLFVGLSFFLNARGQPAQPFGNNLKLALYLIAGAVAALSLLLRSRMLSAGHVYDRLKEEVDPHGLATNRETGQIDQERLKIIKSLTPLEMKVIGLAGMYFTALLLTLAMNEAVAMIGMMLSILEQRAEAMIPFAAAALALNLLVFPRFHQFVDGVMSKYPQAGRYSSSGF